MPADASVVGGFDTSPCRPSTRRVSVRRRLGCGLLLIVVVTGCGSSEQSSRPASSSAAPTTSAIASSSAASATPVESPAGTPSPSARPWKTYRSARFHYSLKYPPDWVVTPGSAKLPDAFDDFERFIYASRTTVSGTASLSLTIAFETNYMKSHYRAKLLTSASLTAARWPAKLLTFHATRDGRRFFVQELIVVKGNAAYFLVWWSDQGNEAADRSLFRRIFRTFRRI
jgi:hypothetical protein